MVSTWDHNQHRTNEYLSTIWSDCTKINQDHYYFVGAKEENRVPMVEALLMNYNNMGNTKPSPNKLKIKEQTTAIQKELPW